MKKYIITLLVIAGCLIPKLGLAVGGFATLVTFILTAVIVDRIEHFNDVVKARKQYEDLFVVSNHPKTGEEVGKLDDDYLEDLLIRVPFNQVIKTVKSETEFLIDSGNRHIENDNIKEKYRLQVIPIIYRDGEFICETWTEYQERIVATMKQRLSERHKVLQDEDRDWYNKFSNRQAGVAWTVKKA